MQKTPHASMLLVCIAFLSSVGAALFPGGKTPAAASSQAPDLLTSSALEDVLGRAVPHCTAVLITQGKPKPFYNEELLQQLLSKSSRPWVVFGADKLDTLAPPRVSSLAHPDLLESTESCVVYVLLTRLQQAGLVYKTIFPSDWYPGTARYFVWLSDGSEAATEITRAEHLRGAFNVLYLMLAPDELSIRIYGSCPFCGPEESVQLRASWTRVRGLTLEGPLVPDPFTDCMGHMFRVVALEYSPFIQYEKPEGRLGPLEMQDCIDVRTLDIVAVRHNFTYEVYEPPEPKWGSEHANGSWTGMIGAIERREADLTFTASRSAEREQVVDFSDGYFSDPLVFVTTKAKPRPQWLSLLRPFTLTTWVFLLAFMSSVPLVYWVLLQQRLRQQGRRGSSESTKKRMALRDAYFGMVGAFLNQKLRCSQHVADQTFIGTWVLMSYVVTISYVSSLTASLTVPSLPPPLDTLDDLVKSDQRWGLEDFGGVGLMLFKNSEDPVYQELYRHMESCADRERCLDQASSGTFAFISWKAHAQEGIALHHTDAYGATRMHVSREEFFPSQFVFALQRGSPLKRSLDAVISSLLEGGLISKWEDDLQRQEVRRKKPVMMRAKEQPPEDFESLSIYHLQGVFYALGLSLGAAVVVFAAEVASGRCV